MQLIDLMPPRRDKALQDAVRSLSDTDETDRGAVFTKGAVVNVILDLVGYCDDRPLSNLRLLEPSFGGGDFLIPAVSRLLTAARRMKIKPNQMVKALGPAIKAVEVHRETFEKTRERLLGHLVREGVDQGDADALVTQWLVFDDFLLAEVGAPFDVVVGNPPYVRQERIPEALLDEYRRRYSTIYDRADLYVPFYEKGLGLLKKGGRLGFICANRWVKNKYGGPLRKLVASDYHLSAYIDMEGTPAFESEVIAYPAITVIERGPAGETRIAQRPEISEESLGSLGSAMTTGRADPRVEIVTNVVKDSDPWLLDSAGQLRVVRRLESKYPLVEEDGCKIGIGVASGADGVFIADYASLPVEDERKVPIVTAPDMRSGVIEWSGRGIVNPWLEDGELASLEEYPRFAAYLNKHAERLKKRHTAKSNPAKWYKTIDRIYPALTHQPKLLIPDIKGDANVVFDSGRFYPHHNLYYVTSETWDLRVLQAVLRSSVVMMFVSAYSVRMAGGFLRFQAQYLRRLRIPRWSEIPEKVRGELATLAEARDLSEIDDLVSPLYDLTAAEDKFVRGLAAQARVGGKSAEPSAAAE